MYGNRPRWFRLIENALTGRHDGNSPIPVGDIAGTQDLIRLALTRFENKVS